MRDYNAVIENDVSRPPAGRARSEDRSGLLRIEKLDIAGEPIVRLLGDTAIVCLTVDLAGKYGQQDFGGKFAYSRVWHRNQGIWQVEFGQCSSGTAAQ